MSVVAAVAAFAAGFGRAVTGGPSVLALYLAGLLPALLAAVAVALPAGGIGSALPDLLLGRPLDMNMLVEIGAAGAAESLSGAPTGTGSAALPAFLGSLGLSGVLSAWFAGGVVERLAGRDGPFVAACNRWCWPFVRLWLLSLGSLMVVAVAATFAAVLAPLAGAALLVGGVAVLDTAFELARAGLVVRGQRGARGGFGAALGLFSRGPAPWLLCLLLLPFSAATLAGQWAAAGQTGLETWSALAAAQLAALLGALVKAWRLGAAVALWERAGALQT